VSDPTPVLPPPAPDAQATLPPLDVDAAAALTLSPPGTAPAHDAPAADGGRYRVLRSHARGGLGEVFVALDTEVGREVALKEIQDEFADDPASQGRFLREAEVNGRLEHPAIVQVYGLGRHADGRPYYVMRLIRGETLDAAARRFHEADRPGRDPGERALALRQLLGQFVAVCNAVAYAHSRGVLHRDIKPANVMLGKFGETLLVDWGLAKVMGVG
jgi:eukaryotic-like serine/threonine-protein kinase